MSTKTLASKRCQFHALFGKKKTRYLLDDEERVTSGFRIQPSVAFQVRLRPTGGGAKRDFWFYESSGEVDASLVKSMRGPVPVGESKTTRDKQSMINIILIFFWPCARFLLLF